MDKYLRNVSTITESVDFCVRGKVNYVRIKHKISVLRQTGSFLKYGVSPCPCILFHERFHSFVFVVRKNVSELSENYP